MLYNKISKKIKYLTSVFTFLIVVLSNFSIIASSNLPDTQKIEQKKQIHKQKTKQSSSSKAGSNKSKTSQQQINDQTGSEGKAKSSQNDDSNADEFVQITDAYARASIPGSKNSALFMKVKNLTEQSLTIIDVQAKEVASKTELHTTLKDKDTGVLKMQKVDSIVVDARGEAELKSGGDHVMLLGLKKELKENDNFEASVSFKEIEPIKFVVKVKR